MADQTLKMDEILNSNGSGFMSDQEMLEFLNRSDVVKGPKSQAVLNDLRSNSAMSDIEKALSDSTQKAIPIENDISFEDYIGQMSEDDLLRIIEQGDVGSDVPYVDLGGLGRFLEGMGVDLSTSKLLKGDTPEETQRNSIEHYEEIIKNMVKQLLGR